MARTAISEKAQLKRLTDRLDFLKGWFGDSKGITAELLKDTLNRVAQTRKAIAAKRFEAVLLYYELEAWYRFLAERIEMVERLGLWDATVRNFDDDYRRWKAAHARRPTIDLRRNTFRSEVQKRYVVRKPTAKDLIALAEHLKITIAGRPPHQKTLRSWLRPKKHGN